jgi:hypothetical protein
VALDVDIVQEWVIQRIDVRKRKKMSKHHLWPIITWKSLFMMKQLFWKNKIDYVGLRMIYCLELRC